MNPYVLENTPDVISIGKRCVQLGYGFHWEPWSLKPYLVLPKAKGGGKLTLVSIGDVPYLVDTWNPDGLKKSSRPACPAPVARRIPKRASSCPATVGDQEGIEEEQEEKHCEVPRADPRGQGGVTEHGRPVRPYAGSTRPPHIDPAVWQGILTEKDKRQAIAEYLKSLESGPTSGSSTDTPSSSSAPAAAATKTKRSDYETKIVCFSDGAEDRLCQELLKDLVQQSCMNMTTWMETLMPRCTLSRLSSLQ